MAERVLITIDEDGGVEAKVEGCAGPGCANLTKAIEDALGTVKSDQKTREFYTAGKQQAKVSNKA